MSDLLRLHLACGARDIGAGWVNVDLADYPHVHIKADVRKIPLSDDCACVIYCSHVLEHFARAETVPVLLEWRRLLASGGKLILSVPDFAAWAKLYVETGKLKLVEGSVIGGQKPPVPALDTHKALFDEERLRAVLEEAEFVDVRRWDWQTEGPGVDDYSRAHIPHLDFVHGRLMSLNLEGVKP